MIVDDPVLIFDRAANGGLWFHTPFGIERYVPIDCGKTPAETGVLFRRDGFSLTKFRVTIRYTYLIAEEPDRGPESAAD